MSKKEPTDRQLVMWWMHEALHAITAYPVIPRGLWDVRDRVEYAFSIRVSEKRCERLYEMILKEVERLRLIYEKKASVLL